MTSFTPDNCFHRASLTLTSLKSGYGKLEPLQVLPLGGWHLIPPFITFSSLPQNGHIIFLIDFIPFLFYFISYHKGEITKTARNIIPLMEKPVTNPSTQILISFLLIFYHLFLFFFLDFKHFFAFSTCLSGRREGPLRLYGGEFLYQGSLLWRQGEIPSALDLHYPAEEDVLGDGEARYRRPLLYVCPICIP